MEIPESDTVSELAKSIENMGEAIARLKVSYNACLADGITPIEVRDKIMERLPEGERAQFMAQWPMLSMMLAAL